MLGEGPLAVLVVLGQVDEVEERVRELAQCGRIEVAVVLTLVSALVLAILIPFREAIPQRVMKATRVATAEAVSGGVAASTSR